MEEFDVALAVPFDSSHPAHRAPAAEPLEEHFAAVAAGAEERSRSYAG